MPGHDVDIPKSYSRFSYAPTGTYLMRLSFYLEGTMLLLFARCGELCALYSFNVN